MPYLWLAARKYRGGEERVVGPDTQLVIDGFQRSGNTFAVSAFQFAQPRPVRVAHHLHAASQIVAAARRGTPTLLLVRDPEGAVLSHLVRKPGVTAMDALRNYVGFHRRVLPYRDRVVVADFREVTSDFGSVIDRVNARFGTSFERFEHTPQNVERCFRRIEERNRELYGRVDERTVPRPSAERDRMIEALRLAYRKDSLGRLRRRAEELHGALTNR